MPHFVRSLSTSGHLVADDFDLVIVAEQLGCGGILAVIRASRACFPQHYLHSEFCKTYYRIASMDLKNTSATLESGMSLQPS